MSSLNELVAKYGEMKSIVDSYKKPIDEANKEIKSIMCETGITECEAGGFKAKYSVSKSEDFNMEKLVEKIKSIKINNEQLASDIPGLIEYIPRVNMDVLEDAIYNGKICAADLMDCKVVKETARLTISKVKEK